MTLLDDVVGLLLTLFFQKWQNWRVLMYRTRIDYAIFTLIADEVFCGCRAVFCKKSLANLLKEKKK